MLTCLGLGALALHALGDGPSDQDLQRLFSPKLGVSAKQDVIDNAQRSDRVDILVKVVQSEAFDEKEASLDALCKLRSYETRAALLEIMQSERALWGPWNREVDPRAIVIQDDFVSEVKTVITKYFGIDVTSVDFFNKEVRQQLIVRMKTRC